ncbi:MAG: hypothetical protein ABIZ80_16975, partial [Bryobacteraceae bacterium]
AITWMLYGWLPPIWALMGGMLFALRIGLLSYWMNSYWGGALATIGGALLLGALPRLRVHWRVRDAVWFGLGIAILGATRPFEGTMTAAAASVTLLVWMFGKGRPPLRVSLVRVALPVTLIAAMAAAGLLYYFQSVTGSPFRMPYVVQREAYATAQYFFWQNPAPQPVYRHDALRDFYAGWELTEFTDSQSFRGVLWNTAQKLISAWLFFFGPLLTIPLLFLPQVIRSKRLRPLLILGAAVLFGMSLTVWFYAHYAAPIAGLLFVVLAQGLRHLRLWRRREGGAGARLVRAIPAVCLMVIAARLIVQPLGFYFPPAWPMTWFHTPDGNTGRASVLARLTAMEGNQLALVRYWPGHRAVMNEWVYNEAAIDQARVVWAREMDAASNRELIRYFKGRRLWLVEADADPPKVTPYPEIP